VDFAPTDAGAESTASSTDGAYHRFGQKDSTLYGASTAVFFQPGIGLVELLADQLIELLFIET
jgi:hypothetical protein